MRPEIVKFFFTIGLIVAGTAAGYILRRRGLLRESLARPVMTGVIVVGYPAVGFLAVWKVTLLASDVWMPIMAMVQAVFLAMTALILGRGMFADRGDRGLLALSCSVGNHGVTMVGFVIFLLFGEEGLGHSIIYCMYTFFALVLLCYPIARHYSPDEKPRRLFRLLVSSIVDVRSVGLPICIAAILLSALGVPRPACISEYHIIDVLISLVIAGAYFSIGLRLHMPHVWRIKRLVVGVLCMRHLLGPAVSAALVCLTLLTPWPLVGMNRQIFMIQSSVPIGVMCVASANMFHVKPGEASTLFVVSSLIYLAVGMPIVLLLFGGGG